MPHLAAFAREGHHLDHLLPIWAGVDEGLRGPLIVPERLRDRTVGLRPRTVLPQVAYDGSVRRLVEHRDLFTLVSSWGALRQVLGTPTIYMEHGLGQSYAGLSHPSYCSSGRRAGVELFLVPNVIAARQVAAANPDKRRPVVVGIPRLDRWHGLPVKPMSPRPVVALTFHWRCSLVPETMPALAHYRDALAELCARSDIEVIGHGHPRDWGLFEQLWDELGVEAVRASEEVLSRADVLVADNTSFLFEFASLDRPVVVLDAPWYRRDIDHGLRFWEAADIGVRCEEPQDLCAAVDAAIADRPEVADRRRQVLDLTVPFRDGHSTARAVAAVEDLLRHRR